MNRFEDILGNTINPGDIVAVGTRSGNNVAIVLDMDEKIRVLGCTVDFVGEPVLNSRWGETYSDRVLVINKSVPRSVKNLLRQAYKDYQKR